MKSLSKTQVKEKSTHQAAVADAHSDLTEAIEAFNASRTEAWAKVEEAQTKHREAVESANGWREGIEDAARGYYDDRSEKWQEGDAGQAYSSWLDALGTEFEIPDDIDEPEDVEIPEDVSGSIEELPEVPDA